MLPTTKDWNPWRIESAPSVGPTVRSSAIDTGAGSPLIGPRYTVTATESILLEVTSSELTVTALAYQNSSIRSHLEAQPENRNPEAYRRLGAAPFPWSLPFDLSLEETRGFLEKLGTSRRTLIEMALPAGPITDRRAAEILGRRSAVCNTPGGGRGTVVAGRVGGTAR